MEEGVCRGKGQVCTGGQWSMLTLTYLQIIFHYVFAACELEKRAF